ncbi:hypothetical protein SCA03_42870 [Streptomyces cacaoi]|uniref:Uncharacterized protein n=1 Tax=Streptomyces cacaoi TaxID=1898 RepID=A0A4Y3R1Y2_STRCI|nr:hypothetical protein SCA03_42870 [Streptomyces cacaoi]
MTGERTAAGPGREPVPPEGMNSRPEPACPARPAPERTAPQSATNGTAPRQNGTAPLEERDRDATERDRDAKAGDRTGRKPPATGGKGPAIRRKGRWQEGRRSVAGTP